jgi:hypothetical protein
MCIIKTPVIKTPSKLQGIVNELVQSGYFYPIPSRSRSRAITAHHMRQEPSSPGETSTCISPRGDVGK